jgi:hypothetical protein
MVKSAYAVSHPRAMVVHALDTFLADPTVMYSGLFDDFTFETITNLIERLYLFSLLYLTYTLGTPLRR